MIEAIGVFFAIVGTLFFAVDPKKVPNHILYAFGAFFISNLFMLHFSLNQGMAPLFIQYVLFIWGASSGLISLSDNRKVTLIVLVILFVETLLLLAAYMSVEDFSFEFDAIQVTAAAIAITGNFLLKSVKAQTKITAFGLFIVADLLYIWIGYTNSLIFFTAMAIFFVLMSSIGIRNTIRTI